MSSKWIPVAVALAFVASAGPVGAQVTDGAKAPPAVASAPETSPPAKPPAKEKKKRVSLNGASKAELKALPGGSDAEAERIIAGRPYKSKAFLVTNKVVSEGRYHQIKALVVAGDLPKATPRTK